MAGYQIKVTMEKTKPPMWRRLAVPERITFLNLHQILQIAFGWNDMHLHDFTFQYNRVSVGDLENMDVDFEEEGLLIDDFLNAGWIRYNYDFGDDWTHKIVLEKELPEYEERYPQVLKFKRNNFEEDSGGVWNGQEQEPYDMIAVNEFLKSACCYPQNPKDQSAGELDICVDPIRLRQEQLHDTMDQFRTFAQAWGELDRLKKEPAPIDRCKEEIGRYFQDNAAGGRWEIRETQKDMQKILEGDGLIHLINLKKYIAVEDETTIPTTQDVSSWIAGTLKEHPEYLLMMLSARGIRRYIKWLRSGKQEGRPADMPEEMELQVMCMWGLAEAKVRKEGRMRILSIAFPTDADCLADSLEKLDLNGIEREFQRVWKRIHGLLMCYGYIDMPVMHEKYEKLFGEIPWDEFCRCLYLSGKFGGGIETGNRLDKNTTWAALDMELAESAAKMQMEYGIELEYADFTKWQVLEMDRSGFNSVYTQWDMVAEMLLVLGLMEWEIADLLNELMESVIYGDGMNDLIAEIMEWLEGEEDDTTAGLWEDLKYALCICWCTVGIPALNGYTRLEVAERTGKSVFDVAADGSFRISDFHVPPEFYGNVIEKRGILSQKSGMSTRPISREPDPDDSCPCGSGKRYRQCCGRKK